MDASYVSSNSFKVLGNLTTEFNLGRRVRCQQGTDGIKYATVSGVSYSAGYTTVVIDESDLTSNLTEAHYGIVQAGQYGSMPVHNHQGNEGDGGYLPGFDTFIELLDTPTAYVDGEYIRSTTTGIEFTAINEDVVAWYHGEGAPSSGLGVEGDYYQDDDTDDVYRKDPGINSTTWNGGDKAAGITLSNGDLTTTMAGGSQWDAIRSIFSVSSGKWYWEITIDASPTNNNIFVGVGTSSESLTYPGDTTQGRGYYGTSGNKYYSSSSSYGDTYTAGDIISVALDMDNGKIWWAKNGVWQASGDPGNGLNAAYDNLAGDTFFAMIGLHTNGKIATANFGASSFSYSVPNGFNAGFGSIATGTWGVVGSLARNFTDLDDTPASYSGTDGQYLMSTGSGTMWAPDNDITTFSGLDDTPDTYDDGYYLRMTASGITTISGIILTAADDSEWLLQVTNSGILYTTEVT